MIRIDEIYENTFLPWVRQNLPQSAIFYFDEFGRSDPDGIMCRGLLNAGDETSAIFFFDQEPVQLSVHIPTFENFDYRTKLTDRNKKYLVVSETNSDNVDYIAKKFNLQPFYYFFHGWAALDWFRGYHRTFLIAPPAQRHIKKTFISPNRIIGGERSHRVMAFYLFQRLGLLHNHISMPKICPVEQQPIEKIAERFAQVWPDSETGIIDALTKTELPMLFPGEDQPRMSSCWLDQFELCAESLVYHVSETVYFGRRQHLTEKTFKPIALGMPFVISAPAHSLKYLRSYGFKTFGSIWSEEYDDIDDDIARSQALVQMLKKLDKLSEQEKNQLFQQCLPIIEHNWNHFYNGDFGNVLWLELQDMLAQMKQTIGHDLSSN
jgi:hypothetical protein